MIDLTKIILSCHQLFTSVCDANFTNKSNHLKSIQSLMNTKNHLIRVEVMMSKRIMNSRTVPNLMALCLLRFQKLDSALCVKVNRTSQYKVVSQIFRIISRLGDGVFWYTVMAGILLAQGQAGLQAVSHMLLAGLTGTLLYKWLKGKTLRPRPYQMRQDIWLTGKPLDHFSFPSGHTLHAVVFCSVALAYYPSLAWLLMPFTILVGISRVILGLHYPSDVVAGAMLGALIASLSMLVMF